MIKITNPADCCGCTSCANSCTHDAITMKPDALGFLYPKVNASRCVDCGLCEKVCSFNPHYDTSLNLPTPYVYACRHKNMEEVETSRSGAAFIAISDWILKHGGVVYGVGYVDHFRVVHKRAVTKDERNEFKGSKYVQSDLGNIFWQVKDDLNNGKIVLFSGTPCQISGLNSYIGKKLRENLYSVDIVCHGVPSPYIWRDYLAYVEHKYKGIALSVCFRDKSELGWTAHEESFVFDFGKKYSKTYSILFNKCLMFRPSCAICPFTNINRPSDLTIGDFWGWERIGANLNADDRGVSLLMINSEKGRKIFDEGVVEAINCIQTDSKHCLQPNLQYPTVMNPMHEQFKWDYLHYGLIYIGKKYADMGYKFQIRLFLNKIKNKIVG